jgi:thiol-disulfide isomerase/thioredoxin
MEESETILNEELPNRKKVFIPIAVILVLVVGALMAIKASVHKETRLATQPLELTEGAEVPNFELTKIDGGKIQIGDLSSKVTMINFWASWCEACMEEMPSIVTLRDQYAPKGFEVVGVNVDENPAEVTPPLVKKLGMKFPIFTDSGNALAELFDVHAIPLTVIINKSRKILLVEPGGRDWNTDEMHQLLDKWVSD